MEHCLSVTVVEAVSSLFEAFSIAVVQGSDNESECHILHNGDMIGTEQIGQILEITEPTVCSFLQCPHSEKDTVIKINNERAMDLIKIRWMCLTSFANAKRKENRMGGKLYV